MILDHCSTKVINIICLVHIHTLEEEQHLAVTYMANTNFSLLSFLTQTKKNKLVHYYKVSVTALVQHATINLLLFWYHLLHSHHSNKEKGLEQGSVVEWVPRHQPSWSNTLLAIFSNAVAILRSLGLDEKPREENILVQTHTRLELIWQ